MGFKPPTPLNKNRYKCIGCVYLCVDEHGDGNCQEFDETRRLGITDRTKPQPSIRCIKGLIEPDQIQEGTNCPKKKNWKPYIIGTHPERAWQAERHRTSICLMKATLVISFIILIATIVLVVRNLVSC